LLFFWGAAWRLAEYYFLGIPVDVVRGLSLHEAVHNGGVYLFIAAPVVALADIACMLADRLTRGRILPVLRYRIAKLSVIRRAMLFVYLCAASLLPVVWLARRTASSRLKPVTRLTMKQEIAPANGAVWFVARTETESVFLESTKDGDYIVRIVANEEIAEIVLARE